MKKLVIGLLVASAMFAGFHVYRYLNPVNKPYQDTSIPFITFTESPELILVESTPAPSVLGFSFCITVEDTNFYFCYKEVGVRTTISEDGKERHQKLYQGYKFTY